MKASFKAVKEKLNVDLESLHFCFTFHSVADNSSGFPHSRTASSPVDKTVCHKAGAFQHADKLLFVGLLSEDPVAGRRGGFARCLRPPFRGHRHLFMADNHRERMCR